MVTEYEGFWAQERERTKRAVPCSNRKMGLRRGAEVMLSGLDSEPYNANVVSVLGYGNVLREPAVVLDRPVLGYVLWPTRYVSVIQQEGLTVARVREEGERP